MKFRKLSVVSLISAILAACTFGLWLLTFAITPWDHKISLSKNIHISVWKGFSGDMLGRLVIFNDAQYGPYRGSIVAIADDEHPPKRVWGCRIGEDYGIEKEIDFDGKGEVALTETAADFPGIYYRHFLWAKNSQPLWTLMISLWFPLFLLGILPAIWAIRRLILWRLKTS